ncbi:MAG: TRAP transporter fused permease subunit [Pseudomonadota bacterium]
MGQEQPSQEEKVIAYQVDEDKVKELVETFDPELRFRKLKGLAAKAALIMCIILALFHIYTAGFGVLQEWKHRCFHLSFVLSLIYLVYPTRKIKIKNLGWAWTYEVIFSFMAGSILALGFQSILKLGAAATGLVLAIGFFLAFAMKTRDLFRSPTVPYLDLAASIVGLGSYAYGFLIILQNWKQYLEESSGRGFAIWTFCMLAALGIPLLFMLWDALRAISGKKKFKLDPQKVPYFEVTLAVLSFAFSSYIIFDFDQFIYRAGYPNTRDFILGNFAILLILEGTRRSIGIPLAILGLFSLAYCYLGPHLANIPGLSILSHRGYSPTRIIDQMYLGTEGIYGVPLGVVATFVFHFVLFGIFTMKTGLGKLFIDLATALAGWSAGGPAKVAIVASGLLGCISGSSVANTVTTGAFTIPMMKKMGYRREFAGAVEASASTGGQFMPPIMGAAAFIMAEFLGISYLTIATCAIVPAICHFFAVGVMVHLEAKKNNMKGIPRDQLPSVPKLIRENGTLVIPLIIIIWLLISGFTPFLAAFWGIISSVAFAQSGPRTKSFFIAVAASAPILLFLWNPFEGPVIWTVVWLAFIVGGLIWTVRGMVFFYWVWGVMAIALLLFLLQRGTEPGRAAFWCNFFVIVVGLFLKEGRMKIEHVLDCLEWGTKNALAIGAACAAVGFIVGTTTLTGLGLKFASVTIELASSTADIVDKLDFLNIFILDHTTLFFLLAYTGVASLILGMGLPTTPNYIVVSIIAAPALMKFGVAPLLSHLFVFYFGILADLTPPVAVAAYAASGISQGDPFKTGVRAFTLAWSGMYVPFAFVFSPILVFMPYILQKTRGPFPYMEFIFVFATVILGIIALGAIIIGFFGGATLKTYQRLILVVALFCLWWHEPLSSYVGASILGGTYLWQRIRSKNKAPSYSAL